MTSQSISADFPYQANYIEVHGSKMHYVDEGAGEPILFLHGNPESAYVWLWTELAIIPKVEASDS